MDRWTSEGISPCRHQPHPGRAERFRGTKAGKLVPSRGAGGDWFGLKEHLFGGQPAEQPLAPHPPQVGALGRARRQFSGSRLTNGSAQYRRWQWQDLVVRQSEGVQPGRQTTVRGYCRTGFQQGRAPTADEQLTGRGGIKMSDSVADGGSSTFSLF